MGFFDKFFKGKKIIEETVEKALESDEKIKSEELKKAVEAESEDKFSLLASKIRPVARQYLPGDVTSIYCLREMLKTLSSELVISESVSQEAEKIFESVKKGELNITVCSATIGNSINILLENAECTELSQRIAENTDDVLLKLWVILDFFISTLKKEFSSNLVVLRDRLSQIAETLGVCNEDDALAQEILSLEKECNELAKDKEKASELTEKRKMLVTKLVETKAIFVLFDNDYNSAFPFISFDGRVEICRKHENCCMLIKKYNDSKAGHAYCRRVEKSDYSKLFKAFLHMGIRVVRFDNGLMPVDIPVYELCGTVGASNIVERFNSGMRGLFLRTSQYDARIKKYAMSIERSQQEKGVVEAMLTCRFNAYRELGNAIVYVFANPPYEKGVTMYTKSALEKAKGLCKFAKLTENDLVAPGDAGYKVYDGGMNFRVTRRNEDDTLENSYICVFTSRLEAEKARLHFEKFGCNDSVVAITFDELATQINSCAGALIDMSSYSFEIKKREFEEIKKWRAVKGNIVVNLKKKEENKTVDDSETPSQNDEKEV